MGELPVGWVNTRLGEVVEYAKTIKIEPSVIKGNEWVLELEDIEKKSSKLLKRLRYSARKSKSTKNRFLTGDVLYGKLRPYLDKIIIADQDGYCSTEIIPISPNAFLNGRYLFYSLKRKEFLNYVDKISHGLNMPRLGTKQGQLAPFILSPLNEQICIANKLDSLLAKVEAAQTRLDKIPTLLKRFRQAVLAAATSGELTKEWREENNIVFEFNESTVSDIAKPEKYSLGIGPFGSNLKVDDYRDSGHPLVFVREIRARKFGGYKTRHVDSNKFHELKAHRVKPGNLLITKMGDPPGDVAIYPKNMPEAVITSDCIKLDVDCSKVLKMYVYYYVQSHSFRKAMNNITAGVAQQKVNLKRFRELSIYFPCKREQKQIVKQVESLFTLADKVEKQYQQARQRTDKLTQSLLAKAFKGELVPQDPNDEPAEKLLARIQAEREKLKPKKTQENAR